MKANKIRTKNEKRKRKNTKNTKNTNTTTPTKTTTATNKYIKVNRKFAQFFFFVVFCARFVCFLRLPPVAAPAPATAQVKWPSERASERLDRIKNKMKIPT